LILRFGSPSPVCHFAKVLRSRLQSRRGCALLTTRVIDIPKTWGNVSLDSWILLDNGCPAHLRHNVLAFSEGRTENKIDMMRWAVD
jgi:hypothetical protein